MIPSMVVIIEKTATGYSAYAPDLPGCISTGTTKPELKRNLRAAIEFHLDGLRLEGEPLPVPQSSSAYVPVGV
jgi:predicted RNase H-like HicB family nuclease